MMTCGYDIYKQVAEDKLLWMNRVKGLEEAKQLVAALRAPSDNYVVYDIRERTVVEIDGPSVSDLHRPVS